MKRALIITYYWPPAGGPGVQRWLQFVKNFKAFGIEPIVYVPENPHYPIVDLSLIGQVPDDVEIIKHPISEPYRLAGFISKNKTAQISSGIITNKKPSLLEKFMLFVRGNFFIPDARVGWVKPSVNYLADYLSNNPVDLIITSGPPHSLHLIGMALKQRMNLNWIADFRDPWTTIHYHKALRLGSTARKKHKKLEKQVLNEANAIVVTSLTTKKEFESICTTPIEVITNGFVAAEGIYPVPDTSFSIAHIGSFLSERNPEVLWKVLSEIASEDEAFKNDLKIKLAGVVSDTIVESITEFSLSDNCDLIGYVSHSDALQIQHNAQILLLVEIDSEETRSIIPGKLFEYLAARRPIIGLGPAGSDIESIINETQSGKFFQHAQEASLKAAILTYYSEFKKGALESNSIGIDKYNRRELSKRMADLIKQL